MQTRVARFAEDSRQRDGNEQARNAVNDVGVDNGVNNEPKHSIIIQKHLLPEFQGYAKTDSNTLHQSGGNQGARDQAAANAGGNNGSGTTTGNDGQRTITSTGVVDETEWIPISSIPSIDNVRVDNTNTNLQMQKATNNDYITPVISENPQQYYTPEQKAAHEARNRVLREKVGRDKNGNLTILTTLSRNKHIIGLQNNIVLPMIDMAGVVEGVGMVRNTFRMKAADVVSSTLRSQKQLNEHTFGGSMLGNNSYLSNLDDAKSVLNAAISGDARVLAADLSQNRVYVRFDQITGYYNNNNVIVPTNKFMIKGNKSSTVVPIHPKAKRFKKSKKRR